MFGRHFCCCCSLRSLFFYQVSLCDFCFNCSFLLDPEKLWKYLFMRVYMYECACTILYVLFACVYVSYFNFHLSLEISSFRMIAVWSPSRSPIPLISYLTEAPPLLSDVIVPPRIIYHQNA